MGNSRLLSPAEGGRRLRRKFRAQRRISQGGFIPPWEKSIGAPARPGAWGAAKMLEFEVAAALRD